MRICEELKGIYIGKIKHRV